MSTFHDYILDALKNCIDDELLDGSDHFFSVQVDKELTEKSKRLSLFRESGFSAALTDGPDGSHYFDVRWQSGVTKIILRISISEVDEWTTSTSSS